MNKKAKTIFSMSILIFIMLSMLGVFVLADESLFPTPSPVRVIEEKDEALMIDFSSLSLVNRSMMSDTFYDDSNEKYLSRFYPKPVNMKNLSGQYEPYEDLTDFSFDGENLVLKWNNKVVRLEIYTGDENNNQEKLKDKSIAEKNELNFNTEIKKGRGSYYFNHTLVKDKQKQPKKVGYEIKTENVDCVIKDYSLVCDEQTIDFSDAVKKQNLSVNMQKNSIEISGGDLSYIDPSTSISLDDSGDWGEIEWDGSSTYDFDDEDLTSIGSRDTPWLTRGFMVFDNIDDINNNADIEDVDLYMYILDVDSGDCDDNNIDIRFYEMDEEDYDKTPDDQEEMQEIWDGVDDDDFYGGLSNLDSGDEDDWVSKDLGHDADSEVETLIDGSPTDEFMIGIKVEPDDENTAYDCNIDFEDTDGDSELPYIIITYTIPDTTAPTTSASATSPPGGSSYTFGTVTEEDVRVTLSCSDGGSGCKTGYPKYCLDTSNTCSPLTTYSSSVGISTGGISYIRYRSQDKFNNTESVKSKTIIIDKNYTQDISLTINGTIVWNYDNYFSETKTTSNLTQELNNALENCEADEEGYCIVPITIHSDNAGKINLTDINIYFNITKYSWDISGLESLSTYRTRIKATDGLFNSSWDESDSDFEIESGIPPNDLHKFYIYNFSDDPVAWFGDEGNIVLKGNCYSGGSCDNPGEDSFIIANSSDEYVAFINSSGDLCVESGDCSDQSATCDTSPEDAFIIRNESDNNVIYFDKDGDLCLVGNLYENSDYF